MAGDGTYMDCTNRNEEYASLWLKRELLLPRQQSFRRGLVNDRIKIVLIDGNICEIDTCFGRFNAS